MVKKKRKRPLHKAKSIFYADKRYVPDCFTIKLTKNDNGYGVNICFCYGKSEFEFDFALQDVWNLSDLINPMTMLNVCSGIERRIRTKKFEDFLKLLKFGGLYDKKV